MLRLHRGYLLRNLLPLLYLLCCACPCAMCVVGAWAPLTCPQATQLFEQFTSTAERGGAHNSQLDLYLVSVRTLLLHSHTVSVALAPARKRALPRSSGGSAASLLRRTLGQNIPAGLGSVFRSWTFVHSVGFL